MQYSYRFLKSACEDAGTLYRNSPEPPQNKNIALPFVVPNLLTPDECELVRALEQDNAQQEGRVSVSGKKSDIRESKVQWLFPAAETNWVFDRIESAIEKANASYKFDLFGFFQGAQVGTYHENGYYDWHPDMGVGNTSNRKLSISVLLSRPDEFTGGDLEFKCIGGQVPRTQGVAIVFPSYLIHRVAPVTSGTRISLVSWISGPPFR
jgi:PKHD-type hydroxylase